VTVLNVFKIVLAFCTASLIVGTGTVAGLFWHFSHGLPDHKQLADYQPATVSRLYAADGRLLAEYAKEKRTFVPVAAMPKRVLQAFVAAEDQRFFSHPGVDVIGVIRAVIANISHPGSRPEGASGITQQVAKNFLLTNQATLSRKIREAILAFRIERTYSKQRILELYLNEIYLGSGNYGVAQAALNYFDRSLGELTLSETAYLAALPKAPNRYNIVRNEKEAYARRDYVLGRMQDDGYISAAEVAAARAEKLVLRKKGPTEVVTADFFAEEVRRNLLSAYGEKGLYEGGLTVSTTLDPLIQQTADKALRDGLIDYDRRHGWRGPYAKIADMSNDWEQEFARIQQRRPLNAPSSWQLAVVTAVGPQAVTIAGMAPNGGPNGGGEGGEGTIPFAEMQWARQNLPNQNVGAFPARPANVVSVGDVIVVEKLIQPTGAPANAKPYPPKTYGLRQIPNVNGAVVVMDPQTGRVLAMSGGWSYGLSQFNRAVQAARQPGSAFKPFVYLAAMDAGLTPATVVEDEPFSYNPGYGQPTWSPKNYGGDFMGPMTLQRALELSRNLVTVRVAQHIGMKRVAGVAKDFGVVDNLGLYLPNALGSTDTTLLRMTMAYAMIANGAREITPSLVDRVQDREGKTIYRHEPRSCRGCGAAPEGQRPQPPEIIDGRQPFHDPATTYQIAHMLQGVTQRGTAGALAVLGRPIMGKTGTTNDSKDNWFMGSTPDITIGIYIGFDEPRTLGPTNMETGGGNAVPIYKRIADVVFKDKSPTPFKVPPGLRMIRWSYEGGTIDEVFKPGTEPGGELVSGTSIDTVPTMGADGSISRSGGSGGGPGRPTLTGTGETY
jgi:penicillin-binding protein 1A